VCVCVCVYVSVLASRTTVKEKPACSHSVSELAQVVYIFMDQERHTDVFLFFSFTRRVEVEDCYYSTITKLKSYHDAPCAAMQHIFDEPA